MERASSFRNSEIEFTNLYVVDLICALALVIIGIFNYLVFGLEGGRYPELGSALGFQGVSWFLISGVFPLLMGILLLIGVFSSYSKIKLNLNKSQETQDNIRFELIEKRILNKKDISLNHQDILGISIKSNKMNNKISLLFVMCAYCMINFRYGIGNLHLPQIEGFPIAGFTLIFSSVIVFLAMLFLVVFVQWRMLIFTNEGKFWVELFPMFGKSKKMFKTQFMPALNSLFEEKNEIYRFSPYEIGGIPNIFKLAIGLIVLLISSISFILIDGLWNFLDNTTIVIGILFGIALIADGIHQATAFYGDGLPFRYPFTFKNGIFFEYYISRPRDLAFKFKSRRYQNVNWYVFGISVALMVVLSSSIIRYIIAIIQNPSFWWRGIISIVLSLLILSGVVFNFLEKKSQISIKFADKNLNYPLYSKHKLMRKTIKFSFMKNKKKRAISTEDVSVFNSETLRVGILIASIIIGLLSYLVYFLTL